MKAIMKTEPRPGIQLEEIPVPPISQDEVLIRVKAVGICGSDVQITNRLRGTSIWPSKCQP
jgi:threonine 3-dehydrogenase